MHRTGKKLLSVLLALAMVLSLLPGAALLAAADDVTYVQITSTPTAETLANMLTYDQEAALVIYNSAEFQAGAGPNGGIVLIYNVGEADGEYMVIHNAQGTPEVMSVALDTIGMLLQYGFNVYIVQPGGSVTPPDPPANPAVYYQYYTLNTADWSITPVVESTTNYTLVTSSNSNWNSGWYVVSGDVTINELVEFSGTVRLILCDGASLTVTEGIWATAEGSKLIIYPGVMDSGAKAAPTIEGSGALHANASYPSEPGIGGNETLELEIHGGVIEATGGNGAAGIGGGYGRNGCTVTIYGGSVTATGGSNAAAIGGADGANGGNVSIYGGTVNAIGGPFAVGIGAGYEGVSDGALNFNSEGILLETSDDNLSWSVYSDGAPRGRYMRAQVIEEQPPAAIPSADEGFFDDFEGEFTWTIQNGSQTNAWYLGEAVNNGGSKALYVSNDGGVSNTYTVYTSSFVFVEKTFSFEGGNYNFAYDWRGDGESAYDFIRMALIPVDFEVTAGSTYPVGFNSGNLPEGWISIDGRAKLNLQSEWQHDIYEDVRVPAGLYRAAIIWRNDTSAGSQPAGAIDNFSVSPVGSAYVPVTGITLSDEALELEVGETAILTATVEPDNATDPTVIWTSSDETVAAVDENGVVTAIAEGEADIIAAADGVSAVCTVTVTAPPITDGFYLIGPNGWTVDDLREEDRFDLNPNAEGEYMLSTELNVDDPVKVVKVENGAVSAWYPDGVGNEYIVDGPHSGTVSVYFRETWNDAWAEIGGFFWIEAQLTEPYLDESLNFFTSISVDIELSTRYSIPVEMVENYASWYLEVSKLNADGEPIETRIFGDGGESVEMVRSAVWQAAYKDISVKELGTSFAATLHVFAPNGQESYSPTQIDNLRNVVLDVLVTDETPDQYQTVAADLLNFAAAAQIYFNYDVEHLANEDLSENAAAALEQFASSGEALAEQINSPEGPTIFSSVSIKNRIVLSLAVSGAGSANAVQLQIRNHETGEVKDIIDAAKRGSIWMGSYRGFGAEDMRTAFDIVAIADGEEFGTPIIWSLEGYAQKARLNEDSTEEELNLFNALLHYVDSCVAVFAS